MVLSSFIECECALLSVYCGYLARWRCLATLRLINGILAWHDEYGLSASPKIRNWNEYQITLLVLLEFTWLDCLEILPLSNRIEHSHKPTHLGTQKDYIKVQIV